jgi:hypothetical protein
MSFQRRFTNGLGFDANYTFAKALSDITGFSEEGQQGWSNANAFDIRGTEYGNAENEIKNRFAFSSNYELQYGKDFTGIKRAVLHGWQANLIMVWQSGKPFSVTNGGGSQPYGNRAVPFNNGGNDRPNTIGNPKGDGSMKHFVNVAAFAPQPLGTIGNTERNSLFGPQFRHADLSIFKDDPNYVPREVQFALKLKF